MSQRDRENLLPLNISIGDAESAESGYSWPATNQTGHTTLDGGTDQHMHIMESPATLPPVDGMQMQYSWTALPSASIRGTPTATGSAAGLGVGGTGLMPQTRERRADSAEIDLQQIEQLQLLGRGAFGRVMKCQFRSRINKKYAAIKIFEDDRERGAKAFRIEKRQLVRVQHPNIVQLFGVSPANTRPVFLVLEYMEDGSLYDVLHSEPRVAYGSAHAVSWLRQCADAVAFLHAMQPKMLHRDLKSPNLLLCQACTLLKICDFGTAVDLDKSTYTNNKGTAVWMAPEVFEGKVYNEKCDVYSYGIIMWEVFSRQRPFADVGREPMAICWQVHQGLRPPLIQGCPQPLETLMTNCWSKQLEERPNMHHVAETLAQLLPFFPGHDQPLARYKSQGSVVEVPLKVKHKQHQGNLPPAKMSVPQRSMGPSPRRDSQPPGTVVVVETPMTSVTDIHGRLGLIDCGRRYSDAAVIERRNAKSDDQPSDQGTSGLSPMLLAPAAHKNSFKKGHRRGGSHETALISKGVSDQVLPPNQGPSPTNHTIVEETNTSRTQLRPTHNRTTLFENGEPECATETIVDLHKYNAIDQRLRPLPPLVNNEQSFKAYIEHRQAADEYLKVTRERDQLKAEKERLFETLMTSNKYSQLMEEKKRLMATVARLESERQRALIGHNQTRKASQPK